MKSIVIFALSCTTIVSVYGCTHEPPKIIPNQSPEDYYARKINQMGAAGKRRDLTNLLEQTVENRPKNILFGVPYYSKDFEIDPEYKRKVLNYLTPFYLNEYLRRLHHENV